MRNVINRIVVIKFSFTVSIPPLSCSTKLIVGIFCGKKINQLFKRSTSSVYSAGMFHFVQCRKNELYSVIVVKTSSCIK